MTLHFQLTQEEQLPDFWPLDKWEQYFIDIFSSSPVLCRYLNLTRGWYPDKMIQLMEAGERARIQKNTKKEKNLVTEASSLRDP